MAKINEDVKKVMAANKIMSIATASKDGVPNVIPIAFVKCQDDDTILLADNFMDKTLKNLEENPRMAFSVWDMENKKAYQLKGEATIVKSGEVFDQTVAWVKGAMPDLNPKSAVLMKVTNVYICQPGPDLGKEL